MTVASRAISGVLATLVVAIMLVVGTCLSGCRVGLISALMLAVAPPVLFVGDTLRTGQEALARPPPGCEAGPRPATGALSAGDWGCKNARPQTARFSKVQRRWL